MMPHFLVFAGRKWENVMGRQGITWDIAGIFHAADADTACLVAAQKQGVGTTFAVEGTAWGVDTVEADDAQELGVKADPLTRLERMGRNLERRLSALPASTDRQALPAGDDDE
jgi:hypothetical protein